MRSNIGTTQALKASSAPLLGRHRLYRSTRPQLVRGIFVPSEVLSANATNSSCEMQVSTKADDCGSRAFNTMISVEQMPSTGAIPTLWKYGRSFPNKRSPLRNISFPLVTLPAPPQSDSAIDRRGMCSNPIYGVLESRDSGRTDSPTCLAMSPSVLLAHPFGFPSLSSEPGNRAQISGAK